MAYLCRNMNIIMNTIYIMVLQITFHIQIV